MKIKSGFILRTVAGKNLVVPVGERASEFSLMVSLNSTGAFLWEKASSEFTRESLTEDLMKYYGISSEKAAEAVDLFLDKISREGFLEDGDL